MAYKDSYYNLLCEREALKMEFLAQKSPIAKFIKNSLKLWYASQWDKSHPTYIFYGYGLPQFAVFRQIERKRALDGAREADKTGNLTAFMDPFESMVQNIIKVGEELDGYYRFNNTYKALREFHTAGFVNPFTKNHINMLAKEVEKRQGQKHADLPPIPKDVHDNIVSELCKMARLDLEDRVEIFHSEAPACLGYPLGGVDKGVKLGVTYNEVEPLKSILNNWHEIGHACYRQYMPLGYMVPGRAMDEAVAFMFEYHIGYSEDFMQFILDKGLSECGYTMDILKSAMVQVKRRTQRIETDPLRHPIDIYLHSRFEEIIVNEGKEGVPPDAIFAEVIEPFENILPDDYSFYQDAHTRGGIFGDREAYNAGYAAAFQIGQTLNVTMDNLVETVRRIAKTYETRFDKTVEHLTDQELSITHYMQWIEKVYGITSIAGLPEKQLETV